MCFERVVTIYERKVCEGLTPEQFGGRNRGHHRGHVNEDLSVLDAYGAGKENTGQKGG